FRQQGHELVDWIADYLEHGRELPVLSRARPGELMERLPQGPPEEPRPWSETMQILDEALLPGITHWNHPRFFAYFSITGSAPGILAGTLSAALNVNAMLWRTSPAATELEHVVVRWLAEALGLPASRFGVITDTASISSLCALAAARHAATDGRVRARGLAREERPLRLYVSDQAHSSIDKAAILLGLGHDGVRTIPSDGAYRMDPEALRAAVAEDRAAGLSPFCVAATAGTTSTTSVDPLPAIAELCEAEGLWLHVDAAYAGSAAIVPEKRPLLEGWERADSLVVNPHKWLFTPVGCSVLYTRRPETLRQAFRLVPEYLRSDVGDTRRGEPDGGDEEVTLPVDFMDFGIQLGRPFRALKLWMVFRAFGRRGLTERIRAHLGMAAELAARIDADPDFERLAPTPFSTLCFRCRPGVGGDTGDGTDLDGVADDEWARLNEDLLERVNREGDVFLSHTRLRGRLALRLAIGNLRTTPDDVDVAWQTLRRTAHGLRGIRDTER
ncbi:MAG: pyridoxal phosphate-dependent decarboxylase family protein, partial [Acidobacteriota bacterium]